MSFDKIEQEMLQSIDVDKIVEELGLPSGTENKKSGFDELCDIESRNGLTYGSPKAIARTRKTKRESSRCKKTGKIQFETAQEAIEAYRHWKMVDRDVCWDMRRMRIYKCKKCHKLHLGKR